ncbi:sodium:glutamate symporter [Salipaludibacillus agaradhaerens]|uniref:sodium/glutamate symporter n=1 Tax=Salipaludibacillus agaradhaerens TaxID=76935 RepID=UPI002151BF96|nr:sodium/glutamate symporter [Salipaludibacillus agaradhaerens]MCR6105274.1 sodium:glutamate symporter [Salipaludibacillus agaradhaerens]MCR6117315.1 sodium:glutamate symporter [Salipaludibacillus agaradhaerens]
MALSPEVVGFSFIILGILLLIGKWLRVFTPFFQTFFIPSSMIAGLLGLLLGPEVMGLTGVHFFDNGGVFPEAMIEVWSTLPDLLINVIFASLFLGMTLPSVKKMWKISGPQITFAHVISWGQYVVGITLALVLLTPLFGMNPAAGALLEISFVGGHGTAAGLAETFEGVGFEEGRDLAVGLATIGVLSGVFIGMILINWGARRGKTEVLNKPSDISDERKRGLITKENQDDESAGKKTTHSEFIETLTVHLGYIGVAIALGYVLLEGLILIEEALWIDNIEIVTHLPLFPLAMIGAVIVQLFLDKCVSHNIVDRGVVNRIQGLALDLLIAAAIATLSLSVIGEYIWPFLLMAVFAIGWNLFAFLVIAPRIMPDYWFERAIGDLGQAMGMSAAGLLLIKLADPDTKSPAKEGFSYKQLLLDIFVGGGLVTAASVPLIVAVGPVLTLIVAAVIMTGWLMLGLFYFGRKQADTKG